MPPEGFADAGGRSRAGVAVDRLAAAGPAGGLAEADVPEVVVEGRRFRGLATEGAGEREDRVSDLPADEGRFM